MSCCIFGIQSRRVICIRSPHSKEFSRLSQVSTHSLSLCLNHLWEYFCRSLNISRAFISSESPARPSSPPWKWLHCVWTCEKHCVFVWYSIFNDSSKTSSLSLLLGLSLMNIPMNSNSHSFIPFFNITQRNTHSLPFWQFKLFALDRIKSL